MSNPEWVGFVEVPGILMIRLMSRCNEKCLFCMVADEIAGSDDLNFQEAVARIASQPPGTLIEFFGGEPTIYPRFLDLLRETRQRGYPCSIATNLRIFHSRKFTRAVADLDASQIYIRTSIYGSDVALHDYYTATPGSYAQTLAGIHNIVAEGFRCQVNFVILKDNYRQLADMARQVSSWGVPRIKFGNLINVSTCAEHAVSLPEVRPYLLEAIAVAEDLGLAVTVEKTPICMAGGRIDLLSTERTIYGQKRIYDENGACSGCLVRRWCDGVDRDYAARFGFEGLERLDRVPACVVRPLDPECRPELLKMYCVAIDDAQPDAHTLVDLEQIWTRVSAQHGDFAVFPRQFLGEATGLKG